MINLYIHPSPTYKQKLQNVTTSVQFKKLNADVKYRFLKMCIFRRIAMSQPNIPNITPIINISREDAINMLIASIAMEEMGLAHIINAEGEKIQYVLSSEINRCASINDIKEINQGVDKIIRDATRLQMLLQEKLETVLILSEGNSECSCKPKPSPKPKPKHCPPCSLIGCGSGCINNKSDDFYGFIASVEANTCANLKDDVSFALEYKVFNNREGICRANSVHMMAIPESIEVICANKSTQYNVGDYFDMLIIKGKGVLSLREKENKICQCTVSFDLTIRINECEQIFQMLINSKNPDFSHDSGKVLVSSGSLEIKNISKKGHPIF